MPEKNDILSKIIDAELVGRGGASFPVAKKWAAVKEALRKKKPGILLLMAPKGNRGLIRMVLLLINIRKRSLTALLSL